MLNSTKIKRERQRLDDMVTKVGMPPGWDAARLGCDRAGLVEVERAYIRGNR